AANLDRRPSARDRRVMLDVDGPPRGDPWVTQTEQPAEAYRRPAPTLAPPGRVSRPCRWHGPPERPWRPRVPSLALRSRPEGRLPYRPLRWPWRPRLRPPHPPALRLPRSHRLRPRLPRRPRPPCPHRRPPARPRG